MKKIVISFVCCSLLLGGCVNTGSALGTSGSAVELRSIQSRSFDTTDKAKVMRGVIASLQDLGFMIDKADQELGTVSATQFSSGGAVKATVSVRASGKQTIVRANAQQGLHAIEEPKPYQNFFDALSQSLFLADNDVN